MIKKLIILLSFTITIQTSIIFGYDGSVHYKLNEQAVLASQLDFVLKNRLGIFEGIETELMKNNEKKELWDWIAFGGDAEDYGKKGKGDFWSTRAHNHFHDPLEDWNDAGLDNLALRLNYHLHHDRYPVSEIL
jgi:hypothetical protein